MTKARIGISACLLGINVRYDGGNALNLYLREELGKLVEFVPVCPEAELGLGIPREKIRLTGNPQRPRVFTIHTKIDWTEKMEAWAAGRVISLKKENLRGFIFKSSSPSCGLEQVKVYDADEMFQETGAGIFARIFREHFPLLPVAEETNLLNQALREDFLRSIFAQPV
ncbi:MAG TPA: DUF523 domain-containing protein [Smithellaceae bacterium]|nr:DUF523 domain-containing protein [Smithellaceae bacterium]